MARTAKKNVTRKSTPKRPRGGTPAAHVAAAGAVTPASGYRAKVRMYRQGLGDCFLISLPRTNGSKRPFDGQPFIKLLHCQIDLGQGEARDR